MNLIIPATLAHDELIELTLNSLMLSLEWQALLADRPALRHGCIIHTLDWTKVVIFAFFYLSLHCMAHFFVPQQNNFILFFWHTLTALHVYLSSARTASQASVQRRAYLADWLVCNRRTLQLVQKRQLFLTILHNQTCGSSSHQHYKLIDKKAQIVCKGFWGFGVLGFWGFGFRV